ncbi:MAG: ATP-NAD kinase family protein [Candidatus Bathyarchaeota archaeon]|nr:ATP-NAD kinase family protein [Candidatus Bathyarchaeota archaeon]
MRVGLIVNPVAGLGGRVGLKGTDGVLKEAFAKGAVPLAPQRAVEFLKALKLRMGNYQVEVFSCPASMGAQEAQTAEVAVNVLPMTVNEETSALDTKKAVKLLKAADVDLLVFVGGDGTARDIFDAAKGTKVVPVLGVPAGVKMYSGVFAVSPWDAADAVVAFIERRADLVDFEVMDADEDAIRNDVFDVKLYGYLKGLSVPVLMQGCKEVSPETVDEKEQQKAIARYVVEEMPKDATLILGPGTTVECIAEDLGVQKTVLGVDLYHEGEMVLDVDEKAILETVKDWFSTWIVLSPIGHQGLLLGRGNQQISPEVVKRVGKKHILVVATASKLRGIADKVLRVDIGDVEVDGMLQGSMRVVTDYKLGVQMTVK